MTDRDDFLAWVQSALYEAELALHNGDAGPRRVLWSRNDLVSLLGAWRNAVGQQQVDEAFTILERALSDCTSHAFELQSYDVVVTWPIPSVWSTPLSRSTVAAQLHPAGHPSVSP